MAPFITILIPTKNVAPYIDQVLRSVFSLDYPKELYDVWILDGCSTDGTKEIIKKYPVILRESRCNVPTFYNAVLPEIKGEIVALGDGDALVDPQWLKTLIPHLSDLKVAGAGGLCLTANNDRLIPRVIGYELKERYEKMPSSISRIATMNVLYWKSALLEVGGFDERFDIGYDAEIGHKICAAGYTISFETKAIVYHYNRPTLRSYFRQQYRYGKFTAGLYLSNTRIAAGDEVASFWMNIQPFVYATIAASLLIAIFFPPAGFIGVIFLLGLMIHYTVSAVQLSVNEKDITAMFFVVLCFVRGIAWTAGGAWFVLSSLKKEKNDNFV